MPTRPTSRQTARRRRAGAHAQTAVLRSRSLFRRRLHYEPLEDRRLLALVTVTTLADSVDFNDGVTSLREAIFATNLVGGPDTIDFAPALTASGPATILLTQGELKIMDDLTITGPSANLLTIDASGNDPTPELNNGDGSRIFNISDETANLVDVSLNALALTGGDLGSSLGGGAIFALENLTIANSSIFDNSAGMSGGGIFSAGVSDARPVLNVVASVISGNSAGIGAGGGINATFTDLSIAGTNISANVATSGAGGILTQGGIITDSTINGNSGGSGAGGGIFTSRNPLTLTNSRVIGNSASTAGGIINRDHLMLNQSEVSGNSASSDWGGIETGVGSILTVVDSKIDGNTAENVNAGIYALYSADVTITGSEISGHSGTGIHINPGASLTVTSSAIRLNSTGISGGGTITVVASTISENSTPDSGGGISSSGPLTVIDSEIVNNSAGQFGGGIYSSSDVTIIRSAIAGNVAGLDGGAVHSWWTGNVAIADSTLSNNVAGRNGGGLFVWLNRGAATVLNSTISGNTSGDLGGGLWISSNLLPIRIAHSTIAENRTTRETELGGGILVAAGQLELDHSIVAANCAVVDSDVTLQGNSQLASRNAIVGTNAQSGLMQTLPGTPDADGNLVGGTGVQVIDPMLGPLAYNGWPMFTHALLPGSPAINAGDLNAVAGVNGVPLFDQRGERFARVFNGRIDIGAFEYRSRSDLNLLVDTLADESDDDHGRGDLSLREAVELANLWSSDDSIRFDPALTTSGPATILLTMGELSIRGDLSINGHGADLLTIDASGNDPTPDVKDGRGTRIFRIDGSVFNAISAISGLRLTGGDSDGSGGAILSSGNLWLSHMAIEGNAARERGGGVALGNQSPGARIATIDHSTIRGNSAAQDGGGIAAAFFRLDLTNSTIAENSAGRDGGGLFLRLTDTTISGSTINGNVAGGNGGGIANSYLLAVTNSTLSQNRATINGGGLWTNHDTILSHTTAAFNRADEVGGGVFVNSGNLKLSNAVIAKNVGAFGPDLSGLLGASIDAHFSLIGNNAGSGLAPAPVGSPDVNGNMIGSPTTGVIDPLLIGLEANGGPTLTHQPMMGSPLIDAGDPTAVAGVDDVPLNDQRGAPYTRVYNGRIDIGSIERQPDPLPGDYNYDNAVGAADFVVWRKFLGTSSGMADGNNNGVVDQSDGDIWTANFGSITATAAPVVAAPAESVRTARELATSQLGLHAPRYDSGFQPIRSLSWRSRTENSVQNTREYKPRIDLMAPAIRIDREFIADRDRENIDREAASKAEAVDAVFDGLRDDAPSPRPSSSGESWQVKSLTLRGGSL